MNYLIKHKLKVTRLCNYGNTIFVDVLKMKCLIALEDNTRGLKKLTNINLKD